MAISHFSIMTVKAKTRTKTAPRSDKAKQSRLNFRLPPEIKDRIARAAAITGSDLTEFAVAALNEKADQVIERHDHILLNSNEYHFFLDALSASNTAKPSDYSIAMAERYRRGKRKGVKYYLAD